MKTNPFAAGIVSALFIAAVVHATEPPIPPVVPPSTNYYRCKVSLAWDPSTSPNVTGYKVYWGTASRNYTSSLDVGMVQSATVTNLVVNTYYFFAATAYNTAGESDYSNEIGYLTPDKNGPVAPGNAMVLSCTVEVSTDMINWKVYTNAPVINFTNVGGVKFFKSQINLK